MPLTNNACPGCGACLHTDDLLEGVCITGGCGTSFDRGLGNRPDLPDFTPKKRVNSSDDSADRSDESGEAVQDVISPMEFKNDHDTDQKGGT